MDIVFRHRGNFNRFEKYLKKSVVAMILEKMKKYGEEGVEALKAATPVETGETASAWRYEITKNGSMYSLTFHNDNVVNGWFNVAIMLDVGHGTGTGGWVEGLGYIDPAVQPIFEQMAHDLWLEVTDI
jgi:hypothetical protein